jgi:hypothetical protein
MLQPVKCPVCGRSSIEPVLQKITVQAHSDSFDGEIGGLRTYRCQIEGHIFFVRKADLEDGDARSVAS